VSIIKPYVADVVLKNGKKYNNCEVVDMNDRTVWVRLPDGRLIKRNKFRHQVDIKYISPMIGVDSGLD
jgi:hypothetical protein